MPSWSTFTNLSTPLLVAACRELEVAARVAPPGLAPVVPNVRVAGPVRALRFGGDPLVLYEVLAEAPSKSIVVVDNGGRLDEACVGNLEALEARNSGVGALLVWGAHQDTSALRTLGVPVFSYGASPALPEHRPGAGDPGAARLGDVTVTAEDAGFLDDDGAVFVPVDDVERLLEAAERLAAAERALALKLQRGESLRSHLTE